MAAQSGGFTPDPSWPSILELAIEAWGQPNKQLSSRDDIRWGNEGGRHVTPSTHTFKIFEPPGGGGGYVDMWKMARGSNTPLPPRADKPQVGAKPNGHAGKTPPWENIGTIYKYFDAAGHLVLEVVRTITGVPRFTQRRPDPSHFSGWKWGTKDIPPDKRPLYRLPRLIAADPEALVYFCEGEKDADNVAARGLVSTTNVGGSGKWHPSYAEPLRDRHVIILPDNDEAGRHHVAVIAPALMGVAASVRVLELPGLGHKGDVSDWLAAGGTADELERMARDLPEWTPPPPPPPSDDGPPDFWDNDPPPPNVPGGPGRADDGRPIIQCVPGQLPRMAREAEAAILKAGVEVYQRHKLVRPIEEEYDAADGRKTHSAALLAFTPASMCKLLSEVANWVKYSRQQKTWVECDPPDRLVSILLDGRGDWTVPHVRGVLTCPTLRPDGSILATHGYDPKSRYYLALPSNLVMPAMPAAPTRDDALAALARQTALLVKFPFVDDVSKAVAHCILMTQPLRCAMECSPMLAVSANAPGSGKSFLVDLASAIALGRPCPIIPPGKDENETEKGIRTKLLSSTPAFSVDNVYSGINLPLLNMATERTHISIRLFSVLEEVEIENSVVVFMTGNNLSIVDEQGRRTVRCQIDVTGDIRPEFRTFDINPIDTVMADRGRYIADILIIAKAYALARANGEPRPDIPPMGDSHKAWSRLVREPLVWLGCEDPIKSQEITRQNDPVSNTLGSIINAWHFAFGMGAHTLADAVKYATTIPVFHADYSDKDQNDINQQNYDAHKAGQEGLLAALRDGFAAGKDGVDAHKWGQWMRKFEGRASGDLRFVKARDQDGKPIMIHSTNAWRLSK